MGSMNRRGGLSLTLLAANLMAGMQQLFSEGKAKEAYQAQAQAEGIRNYIRNSYKLIGPRRRPSGAAALKRASMKRRNIAKHNRSASQ